jgi:hypothetical protein
MLTWHVCVCVCAWQYGDLAARWKNTSYHDDFVIAEGYETDYLHANMVCVCIYIYIYIYINTHTHIHTVSLCALCVPHASHTSSWLARLLLFPYFHIFTTNILLHTMASLSKYSAASTKSSWLTCTFINDFFAVRILRVPIFKLAPLSRVVSLNSNHAHIFSFLAQSFKKWPPPIAAYMQKFSEVKVTNI